MELNLDTAFRNYPTVKYKKREVIFHTTDTPSGVFQIKSGYVRLYSVSAKGEELTLLILKPNDFFPTRWAFGDLPMKHVLGAHTDVVAHKIPKEEFLDLMKRNNSLLYEFTHKMVTRISALYDRMNEMTFGTSNTKIRSILVMCADNYGIKESESIVINVPLTHLDFANLVGISRESASKELKNLENQGIIKFTHHILTILDLEKLKSFQ